MNDCALTGITENFQRIPRDVAVICGPAGITLNYAHRSRKTGQSVREEISYELCKPEEKEALHARVQLFRFRVARERFRASRS
jgi:hypothetical protein